MRVFLSHAWKDKKRAKDLARLPSYVHVWVDEHELRRGQELDPTIMAAIEDCHVFLAMVSKAAVASAYVNVELQSALDREKKKDRDFVLPIILEPGLDLPKCSSAVFRRLGTRLHIDATNDSKAGTVAARERISDTLFHWLSDWLDKLEPSGTSDQQFVQALDYQLVEYRRLLLAVKAGLALPLPTLVQPAALAHLGQVKKQYNEYTEQFVPRLREMDDQIRWRFGAAAQRGFAKLRNFLIGDVYQGTAFALNDIIESVNAWDTVISKDESKAADAEARRQQRLAELEPVIDQLIKRTSDYLDTLTP